ncbi:helix-turn-helix domain-containing protein [Streptomyces sp. NPDC004111]|uniref:helix-turn-helix domain-containing protein n=1 Tax=Streptomyces sp. NPDC004111 TaxID=3364690 RepID=UPI00368196D3
MSPSSDFEAARIALGQRLRALRRHKGITARALAQECGWHQSKVSRIENGKACPSPADITAWATACGAAQDTEELLSMAEGIERMYVEWRHIERDGLRRAHEETLPLWTRSTGFKGYSQCLIPGLFQTEAYTRAVLQGIQERRALTDDVEGTVQARMERQQVLQDKGKRFAIILEEAALNYRLAGREVMIDQLSRLISVSGFSNVSLGIIPLTADRKGMWPVEDFWIFDDREAHVETVSAFITVKQRGALSLYQDAFSRLHPLAVYGSDAYPLIMKALPGE